MRVKTRAPGTIDPRALPPPLGARQQALAVPDRPLPVSVVPLPPAARLPAMGELPAPPAPPFAGLPEPRWCVLPALGRDARVARPVGRRPTTTSASTSAVAATVMDTSTAPPTRPVRTTPSDATRLLDGWPAPTGSPAPDPSPIDPEPPLGDHVDLLDQVDQGDHLDPSAPGDGTRLDPARLVVRALSFAVLGGLLWILALTTLPRLGGWQPTVITGHSMEPSIVRGDVIIVRPAPPEAYVRGAVITFVDPNRPGRLITHRVVGVDPDGRLRTKGDNNHDADPTPIDRLSVKGRAVLRIPFAGAPVVWVMDGRWLPLAATAAVLLAAVRTALAPGERRERRRRVAAH